MVGYIILAIFFIGASIILFLNPFNFPQVIMNSFIPWATLTLAFVALFTIVRSDVKERKGRKIKLLVDIMDWVEEIIRETRPVETIEPTKLKGWSDMYEIHNVNEEINTFNRISLLSNHIQILASRIDRKLYVSVRTLGQAIIDLTNEDWSRLSLIATRELLKTHEDRIYSIAKPLLDDIVKRIEEE